MLVPQKVALIFDPAKGIQKFFEPKRNQLLPVLLKPDCRELEITML
jgi:hypothetical protein